MLAIVGVVLAVIAAVLKLVSERPDIQVWLIIIAVICIGVDVAMGWRHVGYYRVRS